MADRAVYMLLEFSETRSIDVLDFSSLLFDVNRLFFMSLRQGRREEGLRGSTHPFIHRDNFRLPTRDALKISKCRFGSPGILEIVATGTVLTLSAIWLLTQIIDKATLWPLNKKKLELEIQKLDRELHGASANEHDVALLLEWPQVRGAVRQLNKSDLKPTDLTIRISPADRI
jgi:hypothetical protein